MAEHRNRVGLNYYAPIEGNQSFDTALPASNRKLYDIGLLSPAAGIAGGFQLIGEKENVSSVKGWIQREP
jgi:hypothetical protein